MDAEESYAEPKNQIARVFKQQPDIPDLRPLDTWFTGFLGNPLSLQVGSQYAVPAPREAEFTDDS